jgi:hypothetical protein
MNSGSATRTSRLSTLHKKMVSMPLVVMSSKTPRILRAAQTTGIRSSRSIATHTDWRPCVDLAYLHRHLHCHWAQTITVSSTWHAQVSISRSMQHSVQYGQHTELVESRMTLPSGVMAGRERCWKRTTCDACRPKYLLLSKNCCVC